MMRSTVLRSAFYGTAVGEIYIPASLKEGKSALYGMGSLKKITWGEGITSILPGLCYACSGLTEFTIPETVTVIGDGAFKACKGLTEVDIPETVKTVGSEAFMNCENLKKATLHEGLTTLGYDTFYGTAVEEVYIPSTLKNGKSAFYGAGALKKVTFSSQLKVIPASLLYGCSALEEVKVPGNVTQISDDVFKKCENLKKIRIMNKKCVIADSDDTISDTAEIWCRKDSTAEAYGEKYERKVVLLSDEPVETGDFDGDDIADTEDAQNVLNAYVEILAGNDTKLSGAQKKTCDVNGDGTVDTADAQLILLYYTQNTLAGIPTEWEDLIQNNSL